MDREVVAQNPNPTLGRMRALGDRRRGRGSLADVGEDVQLDGALQRFSELKRAQCLDDETRIGCRHRDVRGHVRLGPERSR
jgi:hypothetical protein